MANEDRIENGGQGILHKDKKYTINVCLQMNQLSLNLVAESSNYLVQDKKGTLTYRQF